MPQSNFDRWQLYCRDLGSPQSFIDAGYYYMIGASLQRRIWLAPEHEPLYPNQYVVLCGPASIGKGRVIKRVHKFLTFLKKKKYEEKKEDEDTDEVEIILKSAKKQKTFEPNLIPIAADATTWQALVDAFVDSYDCFTRGKKPDGKIDRYHHSSLCFCLEEMSSLFKKQTEDLANFFLKAYDCGDYTYDTRKNIRDRIRYMCLNLFAGTTPKFMQDVFSNGILDDGFSSRTWFIYADKARFWKANTPELDIDQRIAEKELLIHIKQLTTLCGPVELSKQALEFLDDWYPKFMTSKIQPVNTSVKLKDFYGRKNVHIRKLAMAMHFGEHDNLRSKISLETILLAKKKFEEEWEKDMHLALQIKSINPLAVAGQKLMIFLKSKGKADLVQIWNELWEYLGKAETDLETLLKTFEEMGRIKRKQGSDAKWYYYPVEELEEKKI